MGEQTDDPKRELIENHGVDEGTVEQIVDRTEDVVRSMADDYDVEMDSQSIDIIQTSLLSTIADAYGRESDPIMAAQTVADELADPESRKARSNIAVILGQEASSTKSIMQLGGALMRENYDRSSEADQ